MECWKRCSNYWLIRVSRTCVSQLCKCSLMVKQDIRNVQLQVRFLSFAPYKGINGEISMKKYNVSGSPYKNKLFIQSSINEDFDFVSINIGIEEVLCALDNIVNDRDVLSEENYNFLINELENNLNQLKNI